MVFYSDLDNTLIYSYKHDIGKKKRCVETYQGREISFMTEYSYQLLQKVEKEVLFVPVTTRTVEQYQRIDLGIGTPRYALACNGGILLVNGQKDARWQEGSRELVADCQGELRKAKELLERDEDVDFEVRNIERLFVFTKSKRPEKTVKNLQDQLSHLLVDVFSNGIKVYVVPKKLTKGSAVRRFQERMQKEAGMRTGAIDLQKERDFIPKAIAAGDSEFDVPMLLEADVALVPNKLFSERMEKEKAFYMEGEGVFSDYVLRYVDSFWRNRENL